MQENENDVTRFMARAIEVEDVAEQKKLIGVALEISKSYINSGVPENALRFNCRYHTLDPNDSSRWLMLSYAIAKKCRENIIAQIIDYINDYYIDSAAKQYIFVDAAQVAAKHGNYYATQLILSTGQFNINQLADDVLPHFDEKLCYPLNIAIKTRKIEIIHLFLYCITDFNVVDEFLNKTYLQFAESLQEPSKLNGGKNIYSAVKAAKKLALAKKACTTDEENSRLTPYFTKAYWLNPAFVISYLAYHIEQCNIIAATNANPAPEENNQYVLTFLKIFKANYIQPDLSDSQENKHPLWCDAFQKDVILPLIAHTCGNPCSLFKTDEERDIFLAEPLQVSFFTNASFNDSFSQMPGGTVAALLQRVGHFRPGKPNPSTTSEKASPTQETTALCNI
jgi:hypothetical protein